LDAKTERAKFVFDAVFSVEQEITLTIVFTGIHNDRMAGFYRSRYNDKQGNKKYPLSSSINSYLGIHSYTTILTPRWMVTTQFKATDCRRAFPSFDEPNLKATFEIVLNVAPHLTALSNMNVAREHLYTSDTGKELKSYVFATTPLISTYV